MILPEIESFYVNRLPEISVSRPRRWCGELDDPHERLYDGSLMSASTTYRRVGPRYSRLREYHDLHRAEYVSGLSQLYKSGTAWGFRNKELNAICTTKPRVKLKPPTGKAFEVLSSLETLGPDLNVGQSANLTSRGQGTCLGDEHPASSDTLAFELPSMHVRRDAQIRSGAMGRFGGTPSEKTRKKETNGHPSITWCACAYPAQYVSDLDGSPWPLTDAFASIERQGGTGRFCCGIDRSISEKLPKERSTPYWFGSESRRLCKRRVSTA